MANSFYDVTSKTLGRGHYGLVKLAKHSLTGEPVAIKIIEKIRLDRDSLCQLGTEICILFRLSEYEHPNILKLYQVIDTKSKLHLITEYCGSNACDLHDYIFNKYKRNGLPEREAQHIFKQICSAIAYCHSLNIVHRDLKPENILVTDQRQTIGNNFSGSLIKLIDFGFANHWNPEEKMRTSCGTLAYSAPELLLGEMYDGTKVDIWGLGVMLYILLFGKNPFMQVSDNETLARILDCSFTIPQRTDVSEDAINLVRCLIRRNPSSRLLMHHLIQHPWMEHGNSQSCFTFDVEDHDQAEIASNNFQSSHHSHEAESYAPNRLRLSHSSSAVAGSSGQQHLPMKRHLAKGRKKVATPLAADNEKSSSDKIDEDECSSTSSPLNRSRSFSGGEKQTVESSSPVSNGSACSYNLDRSQNTPRCSNAKSTSPDVIRGLLDQEEEYIHDYIVNEILSLGCLCESRESMEQSLRNAKFSNRRFFNSSIVKEVSGVRISRMKSSPDCTKLTKSLPRTRSELFNKFNDEYINATYQLMRDRIRKDIHEIKHNLGAQSCDSLNAEFGGEPSHKRKSSFFGTNSSNSMLSGGIVRSSTERFDARHSMNENSGLKSKQRQQQRILGMRLLQPQNKLKDKFTQFFRGGSLTSGHDNELGEQYYSSSVNIEPEDSQTLRTLDSDQNELSCADSKRASRNIFKYGTKKQQAKPVRNRDQDPAGMGEPSRPSKTHDWKILKTPNRCQECNLYVYFNGCECNLCGFVAHKKCVTSLVIKCSGHKVSARQRVAAPIFGQPLKVQVIDFVKRFVQDIDTRGLRLKGIYRVSSVKSKVDKLCSSYDQNAYLVDLSSFHPNIVANALKLYLRQLPEPLLTFKLYPLFVAIAKKYPATSQQTKSSSVDSTSSNTDPLLIIEMRQVVELLPSLNKEIVSIIMRHLKRVADMAHENQMTASNLSIVFGPTLLNSNDSNTFVDTVHQSRVVELLINSVEQIFLQCTTFKSTAVMRLNLSEMRRQFFVSSTAVGPEQDR